MLSSAHAVIMSLIQSAKLYGHEPYRYLKDVLQRLPTQPASRLKELLPHHLKLAVPKTVRLNGWKSRNQSLDGLPRCLQISSGCRRSIRD
jgi:IS66 C-terminal element